jgi:peptidoglycan hydrolase-like protein with peptidoglycan-binding domain
VRRRRRNRTAFGPAGTVGGVITRHPRESVAILMAGGATLAIFVNALFLQNGPHPAPIFATQPLVNRRQVSVVLPSPHPLVSQARRPSAAAPVPSQAQITADIQRALAQRGYYDGAVDSIWGAKTDAAVRDFVQASGVKVNAQASEALLQAIAASPTKAAVSPAMAAKPEHSDPIAAVATPSQRVLAVQRALADFGYGQIKPTGVYDRDTQAAIESFQRERRLPVDGRISDDFVRELAAMTGRPLE